MELRDGILKEPGAALRLCTPLNMAHSSQGSALVGYSDDTELRPLKLRGADSCWTGMCGVRLHSQSDVLSSPCYDSCVDTSRCVCPLDDEVCATVDVHLRTFPAEYLLTRKVRQQEYSPLFVETRREPR
ncbi:hypothetical protein HPB48_026761 [Haemaphysalis longicornis]|uniref:Uncharacterized protein n=1 Tax=Haemaphysalis longicornis TaxID=44386 RepID=A0A9J6HBK6_HAELO|nr:hypothetical protein HPB48_026761 [Haemaphysalis longicornis]